MLTVSVDGNLQHAARSEEKAAFEGVFIAKDEEVTRCVDYTHRTTKHVSGRCLWRGVVRSQRDFPKVHQQGRREGLELAVCRHGVLLCALNMYRGDIFASPFYKERPRAPAPAPDEALPLGISCKAHDFKCEVNWSGAYQEGAGSTLGEEVEQCNAFLSRIAVTTKHRTTAGRTDMLTLMAMRWNQQPFRNVATSLWHRYQKTTKALQTTAKTTTTSNDADALASRMEVLVARIKRRSQRLYKDTDGSKGRARIRRKIRTEKGILTER
ncbi:hypothetical protein KUCAC02_029765 [Chaenocephalus aceratus]|nr:hypothetical protein KUCAC02_029765 [Chaenocephalus aceratus]